MSGAGGGSSSGAGASNDAGRVEPATDGVAGEAWALLDTVADPEVPAISIVDLGIVRGVAVTGDDVDVHLTPTYSGCPAIEVIERDAATALQARFATVTVHTVLSPPWTTDWMSERGRTRLREAGIAPPPPTRDAPASMRPLGLVGDDVDSGDAPALPDGAMGLVARPRAGGTGAGGPVGTAGAALRRAFGHRAAETMPPCPRCESADVERISQFGSTSCKSLWRCRACGEPFDHFKAI